MIGDAEYIETHADDPSRCPVEEILDEIASKMDEKADDCMRDRENGGDDADIPAEIGGKRIRNLTQDVQGADDQRRCEEEEAHVGGRHGETIAKGTVLRRQREIPDARAYHRDCGKQKLSAQSRTV